MYNNDIFNRLYFSIRVSVALKPEKVFIGKVGWRERDSNVTSPQSTAAI